MTSRVQSTRSGVTGARPDASHPPGTLYTNWADLQIGVMDDARQPVDLVAVPFFSPLADYTTGELVRQGARLLRALVDIPAGAFTEAEWTEVGGAPVHVGDNPPTYAEEGDLWYRTIAPIRLLTRVGSAWQPAIPEEGPEGIVIFQQDTPPAGAVPGNLWHKTSDPTELLVYRNDGVNPAGWVNPDPVNITYGASFPADPADGALHYRTVAPYGLHIYYNDGVEDRWIETNPDAPENVVQIDVIGSGDDVTNRPTPVGLQPGSAWVLRNGDDTITLFFAEGGQWFEAATIVAERGRRGEQGPQGLKGDEGEKGETPTVEVGTTTASAPGGPAVVESSDTATGVILDFTIPRGVEGPRGPIGARGEKGDPGTYVGLDLIGASTTILDRPVTASEGQSWGLIEGGSIRIFVWTSGAWLDAGPIAVGAEKETQGTLYVAPNGNDDATGRSFEQALRTLGTAVLAANEFGDAPLLVLVYPGIYTGPGHWDWPDNCSVHSVGGMRKTVVRPSPGYEERNQFRVGNGGDVEGFSFEGWHVDSLDNPTEGFAVSFRPGALIQRVPYARNIVAYRGQPPSLISAPMDRANGNPEVGRGGGVVLADGALVSQYSPFPNIMTWGATPSVPNGVGYCVKNGALANPVNAVSLWAHKHFMALSGGRIILSGCSSQFGDWSLWSEGSTPSVRARRTSAALVKDAAAATLLVNNRQPLIDQTWTDLVVDGFTAGWTAADEQFTRMDTGMLIDALTGCLRGGVQDPMLQFQLGMFDYKGDLVFSADKLGAFVHSFEFIRDRILLLGPSSAAGQMVTALIAELILTVQTPQRSNIGKRSLITAINHQWTLPLAGVTRAALPPEFGGTGRPGLIQRSVVQTDSGLANYSGQDDEGNAVFVGGLEIDARTGRLGGPPFDAAVELKALEAAIAGSY